MKINDVATAFVRYINIDQGKRRPILIVKIKDDFVLAFKITSQFKNKSQQIRQNYFKITDWQQTGLKKPSWIDTNSQPLEFPTKMVGNSFGHLSEADRISFRDFLVARLQNK
ncbi:Hypothetical protein ADU71_1515 [Pediococcus damnosus]|uniref:hypothetical protein n=1 Tax=Pediococcus damnosus TaxID=51663 RepID=UPI00078D1B90|nr:hypothetical protein [Pediococcus damnosus]AMV61047.1 Hypothetical protein ADU69_1394 [Pediococcus damnosus]AMV65407.1 Hypothetical protein ADU71_1515 [Pediococcus damnosus]